MTEGKEGGYQPTEEDIKAAEGHMNEKETSMSEAREEASKRFKKLTPEEQRNSAEERMTQEEREKSYARDGWERVRDYEERLGPDKAYAVNIGRNIEKSLKDDPEFVEKVESISGTTFDQITHICREKYPQIEPALEKLHKALEQFVSWAIRLRKHDGTWQYELLKHTTVSADLSRSAKEVLAVMVNDQNNDESELRQTKVDKNMVASILRGVLMSFDIHDKPATQYHPYFPIREPYLRQLDDILLTEMHSSYLKGSGENMTSSL